MLAADNPTDEAIAADHEWMDAKYGETTADRERDRREFIARLAKGEIQLVDEAVVATKLRQAHEYTSDLTEMLSVVYQDSETDSSP